MRALIKRAFRDKVTGELYEAGKTITLTRERFEEIKATDGRLVEEVATKKAAPKPKAATAKAKEAKESDSSAE